MAEKKGITVVVPSRKTMEEGKDIINHIKATCESVPEIVFITNQGLGLSELYGTMLNKLETHNDIIVFCHDDIKFLKKRWDTELIRLFNDNKDYGIIGVAGAAEFDKSAAWWNYKKIYGQVIHIKGEESWLSKFSPLLDHDLEEVCVIDGLFMAVNRKRITKNFDASLKGFNFYDIDFCLANYLDGQTKIGVTTNIRLAHKSIGELSQNWYENRDWLNNKYGDYFPISIKK